TRHLTHCGRHESRCLLVIIDGGHHLPCPTVPFSRFPRGYGGDLWVAHTGVAGHGRVGHRPRSPGIGWPDHRRAVVVAPARGGPGRGAGRSADRSAASTPHDAPCRG